MIRPGVKMRLDRRILASPVRSINVRRSSLLLFWSFIFASTVCLVECLLPVEHINVRLSRLPSVCNGRQQFFGRGTVAVSPKDRECIDVQDKDDPSAPIAPIRLNKVFKATHSRREADRMIQGGRVAVNGSVSFGCMVVPYHDEITLDGKVVKGWEQMNGLITPKNAEKEVTMSSSLVKNFEYVKFYKPQGIICTTDRRIKGNIIDELTLKRGYRPTHRVYPVGRLDKDSSGLILITSDGRIPNASLRRDHKQPKFYRVRVDRPISAEDLDSLRSGITITTVAQRDGKTKPLTAKTKPCIVTLLGERDVEIVLEEGRNRQIRKMMAALGYEVLILHRIRFGNISLDSDMSAGDWKVLNAEELKWITSIVRALD